jgi:hypothetical protein
MTKGDIDNNPHDTKRSKDEVDIEFDRVLSKQEKDTLFEHLRGLVDTGGYSVSAIDWTTKTEISVKPVADESAFVSRIDFGRVERIGAKKLRVVLDAEKLERISKAQPGGAANGSQPIRTETNRTSSAAGSRR